MKDRARTGKRLGLSTEDHRLWHRLTRTVTPLPGKCPPDADTPADEQEQAEDIPLKTNARPARPPAPAEAARKEALLPPIVPLERKMRHRIGRGSREIDARIDLHGMTQNEAHGALRAFLFRSQARGHRLVLVITGKGMRKGDGLRHGALHWEDRGVLRRIVPQWLHLPEFRAIVISIEEAHRHHGGEGAWYVWLRKPQKDGAKSASGKEKRA